MSQNLQIIIKSLYVGFNDVYLQLDANIFLIFLVSQIKKLQKIF